jgi:hypothetical protein
MEKKDYEIIISTCGKFSDLWDANVQLLNENWPDRGAKTWLVTDDPTDRTLPGVQIVCAGAGMEITQRLAAVLEKVETEYVVLTLDDYFFTQPIETEKINRVLRFMGEHDVAYTQLYPQPKAFLKKDGARESADYPGIYYVDLSEGNYKVVLTPGIWRTDFMRSTLTGTLNAWQYEVSLTPRARELGVVCATSNCGELPYLDVIRKGKLLRKANRYFKKNPIYRSDRPVMKRTDEWVLKFRTFLKFWMPKGILRLMKRIMIRLGHSFYSQGF